MSSQGKNSAHPHDVHFTPAGYKEISHQVAEQVQKLLDPSPGNLPGPP